MKKRFIEVNPGDCMQGVSRSFHKLSLMDFLLKFSLRELLVFDLDTPCHFHAPDGLTSVILLGVDIFPK